MSDNIGISNRMRAGLKWVSTGQLCGYFLQFVVTVVLARRLPPGDYGALGASLIFTNLAVVFNELGMVSAIIQKKDLSPRHAATALWVCVAMGIVFLLLGASASYLLAHFFQNSLVTSLVQVFAVKVFIDSFGMVPEALLRRELFFNRLAAIDIVSNLIYASAASAMILQGVGVISVGLGYLLFSCARVFLLWRSCRFGPEWGFDQASFKELFHFGKNILGFKMLNYFVGNIDVILIGRFLGAAALGHYSLASTLANFPRLKLSSIVSSVFFPGFSRIQDDVARMRDLYLKIVRYAGVINFSLLAGLMCLAPQFVRIAFSSRWDVMVLPLRILCVYGILFSVTTFVGFVYDATGHPDYSLKFCVVNLLGTVAAVSCGFRQGLVGIATALSAYAFVANILGNLLVKNILGINLMHYLGSLRPAVVSSGIMAAGLLLLLRLKAAIPALPDPVFLLLAAVYGASIYAASLFLFYRKTFDEVLEVVRGLFLSERRG